MVWSFFPILSFITSYTITFVPMFIYLLRICSYTKTSFISVDNSYVVRVYMHTFSAFSCCKKYYHVRMRFHSSPKWHTHTHTRTQAQAHALNGQSYWEEKKLRCMRCLSCFCFRCNSGCADMKRNAIRRTYESRIKASKAIYAVYAYTFWLQSVHRKTKI